MKLIFILLILIILFVLFKGNDIIEGYTTCNVTPATVYTVDNPTLTSMNIGDTEMAQGACLSDTPGHSFTSDIYKVVPDNGEFEFTTKGDGCYYCNVNYPNTANDYCMGAPECNSDGGTVGNQAYFKRSAYTADKNKCCSKSATTDDGKTCDPNYRSMNAGYCVGQMTSLCGTASGFSSNEDACKNFCSVEIQNGKTTCDNLIKTYCESDSGMSDTSCDCINNYSAIETAASEIGQLGDPVCYYSKCLSNDSGTSPLLTKAMSNVDCTICNLINNDITAYNNSGTKINITQTCSTGTSSASTASTSDSTSDSTNIITSLGDFSGGFSSWLITNWIILTIFVVLLIAIIGAVIFML